MYKKLSDKVRIGFWLVNVAASFVSCGETGKLCEETYSMDDAVESSPSEVFGSVELVPLRFEGDDYPHGVVELQCSDSLILVRDKKNTLHVFSNIGNYISSSSGKIGNGPGEYSIMTGWSMDSDGQTLFIMTPNKILHYDKEFNLIESLDSPTHPGVRCLFFEDVYRLPSNRYLISPTLVSEKKHDVLLYGNKLDKTIGEMSYSDDVIADINMQGRCFYPMPDGRLMFSPASVSKFIYEIKNEGLLLERTICLDYGEDGLTVEDIDNMDTNLMEIQRALMKSNKSIPVKRMVSSRKIIVVFKHGKTVRDFYTIVVDRDDVGIKKIRHYSEGGMVFPIIEDIDENCAYAVAEKWQLLESAGLLFDKITDVEDCLKDADDETLILLRYLY